MATVNERLRDAAIDHAIDLAQYSEGVVRRMIRLLNRADADLAAALSSALNRMPANSFTVERLERLLKSVREINAAAYARVEKELIAELEAFADVEANYQLDLFGKVVPKPIQAHVEFTRITPDQVRTAALSRPFQGRLLRDWAKKLHADRMELIRNTVRLGYIEGQTVTEIVRRLIGTPQNRKRDGAFERARRDLTAVVDTAIKHTAAVARERFYAENSDLISEVVWKSTLDSRVSPICQVRADKRYTAVQHKPIGHKIPWLQGPGRIHWRCRSTASPVLKSWRELGLDTDDLPAGTRASMDGQVPGETTYGEWLARQSQERQEQVLGVVRARLMRAGKLKLEDFYSPRGEWLTLDELRERNAEAFRRAGL